MNKVIITGASGFIGGALTKELINRGIIVYAVVRSAEKLAGLKDSPYLHIVEADYEQYCNLPQIIKDDIDIFYHFAWDGVAGLKNQDFKVQFAKWLIE